MAGPKETRRIVGGQVREVTLAEQAQHSLEVSQNAKGDFSVSIKLYFTDDADIAIVDRAKALYDYYKDTFPVQPDAPRLRQMPVKEGT